MPPRSWSLSCMRFLLLLTLMVAALASEQCRADDKALRAQPGGNRQLVVAVVQAKLQLCFDPQELR